MRSNMYLLSTLLWTLTVTALPTPQVDLIPDVVDTAPGDPTVFDAVWICDGHICKRQMSSDGLISDPAADMPDTVLEALGLREGAAAESSLWICGGHVCKRDTAGEKAA